MNVRERFGAEVCPGCEAFGSCDQTIDKQVQCAIITSYFMLKRLLNEDPGK